MTSISPFEEQAAATPPDADVSLASVIDTHLDWFVQWHRLAFIQTKNREEETRTMLPPSSFDSWFKGPAQSLPQDQPAIDRMAVLHNQLHTLAKLVLMRTPEGQALSEADYESVVGNYQSFVSGMRRLERAFSTAAARVDTLTGLRTRTGLAEDLGREIARFNRSNKPFCIAVMDLDHFKKVNDDYGHDAGDRVLMAAANCVSRQIRAYDDAYRLGGEEFLICLKDTDGESALKALERLRAALEATPVPLPGKNPVKVTASFGLVEMKPNLSADDLLDIADTSLYKAKRGGRNRIATG